MEENPVPQNQNQPEQPVAQDIQPKVVVESDDTSGQDVNAFNSLAHDTLGDANAGRLDTADAPKKIAEFQAIKSMIGGVVVAAMFIGFGVYLSSTGKYTKDALYLYGIGIVFGGLFILLGVTSFKQLHKASQNPQQFNQFQSGTAVQYSTKLAPATVGANETVKTWLGPVLLTGKEAVSYGIAAKEVDKQVVNTLLFTDAQVIGVMFGPQDVPASLAGGTLNQIASAGINYSIEEEQAKQVQFEGLYFKKWDEIVSSALTKGLAALPSQHLTTAIPMADIQSIEFRTGMMNPGIVMHMRDGSKHQYIAMRTDQLSGTKSVLASMTQVS